MLITLFIAIALVVLLGTIVQRQKWHISNLNDEVAKRISWNDVLTADKTLLSLAKQQAEADIELLNAEAELRNEYLDYLFQTFYLHLADPFVTRPTFEEKRCYHCHYPDYAGHAPDCAWLHCRPLTEVLYPPAPKVTRATVAHDADIVLPAEPDEEPEAPTVDKPVGGEGYGHGV